MVEYTHTIERIGFYTMINNMIPSPKGQWGCGELKAFTPVISAGSFALQAETFALQAKKALDIDFSFSNDNADFVITEAPFMAEGEYRLAIGEKVEILAADGYAAAYALSAVLQMASIFEGKLMLPQVTLTDKPDCDYRGLLVDTARSFHPLAELKNYVDLCWLYKIKYLHIHFSDDESFTLPCKAFPLLSQQGASYTPDEIAELDAYATSRNVQIVPEVDTPGHTTLIMKCYPEIFDKEGILGFHAEAIEGTKAIYREICEMFPHSDYIHIGGDEGRLGWWLGCDKCLEYGRTLGFNMEDEAPGISQAEWVMLRFLAHYIAENAKAVIEMGKTPIVWEGFHKTTNNMIPKEVKVMVWDSSFQLASSLIADGFEVINCSWLPTYVVTPLWVYSEKACYEWDIRSFGTINDASPYGNGTMRMPESSNLIGGQLNSWGDFVEKTDYYENGALGRADGLKSVAERLPFISENTWNKEKRKSYEDTKAAADHVRQLFYKMIK